MSGEGKVVSFGELATADLIVDGVYQGGRGGNAGDDPFPRLLNVSNMGGFRYRGSLASLDLLVLTSTLSDPDWPDAVDREAGFFTYYGDNKHPGRGLHDTPRNGNEVLRRIFDLASQGPDGRRQVPPILVFANAGDWRDVRFIGLVVPGTSDAQVAEDLVAIWRTGNGLRFQNYRARFSVLDVPEVPRAWLSRIIAGESAELYCPRAWKEWVESGKRRTLKSVRTIEHRTKAEQLPRDANGGAMVRAIHGFFADRPHDFEKCAALIARMVLSGITDMDLTRPSRDGGRDAIGKFKLGTGSGSILVDFALEAKCYAMENPVRVREMSRLISRLRHRQFGILVTTSFVDAQAYREIKEDQHPIVVISASDIVEFLRLEGHSDARSVTDWLQREFAAAP